MTIEITSRYRNDMGDISSRGSTIKTPDEVIAIYALLLALPDQSERQNFVDNMNA